jgi:hypothetical protein
MSAHLLNPQTLIPTSEFVPGNFAIFRSRVKGRMTQLFLEQSQTVTRIVEFHCVNCETITETMRTNVVHLAGLSVNQLGQSCHISALFSDLPSPMPVDSKNQPPPIAKNRTTAPNVFVKHAQGNAIQWQYPLPMTLLLFSLSACNPTPTLGAKRVASAKPLFTLPTRQLDACLEMSDRDRATLKIQVFNRQN